MTTPTERARALRMVPEAIDLLMRGRETTERARIARVMLRHYPTPSELDAIIAACPELLKEAGS